MRRQFNTNLKSSDTLIKKAMDFEQWKFWRELREEDSLFSGAMKCTTASTGLFAVILLGVLLLVIGVTLVIV